MSTDNAEQIRHALLERIDQRLKALNMTRRAAEIKAFGKPDAIRNWSRKDKNVLPRMDTLAVLAPVLETTAAWLMYGVDTPTITGDATPATQVPPLPGRNTMPLDVPVMGTAAGSLARGAFQLEGGVVDYVRRPPALIGARDIYALYVEGSSMEPQYFPGDLIYVNPHKPPRIGDIVVVQCRNGEHTPEEASLGIYRKRTEKTVTIGKRNPVAEIDLARDHVKDIHRVLTTNELFGV